MNLIFDTETTGLPRRGWAPEDARVPHAVQLAAVLATEDGREEATLDAILRWEGVAVPPEAARVHGITTERMLAEGRPPQEVLREFDALALRATRAVAFNLEFDELIVLAAYHRAGETGAGYRKLARACAMQSARQACALPSRDGKTFKVPSLAEAHRTLVGSEFAGAHTALGDAWACAAVVTALQRRRLPLTYAPPPVTSVVDTDLRWLDEVLTAASDEIHKLTDWENGFIADFAVRRERYGEATTISDKQRVVLERIRGKVL